MKYTTTQLTLTIRDRWRMHERTIRDIGIGGIFVTSLLLIHSLLSPAAPTVQARPTPALAQQPIYVIQATPAPTLPPAPTATPQVVYVEVQSEPEVIYVDRPVEAPPTMEAPAIEIITEEKPADDRAAHYYAATSGHGSKVRDR